MNVGIIGATGYTGEELIALLARHPRARLAAVASRSLAGQSLGQQFPRLRSSRAAGLAFLESDVRQLAAQEEISVWFLALPHGVAAEFALPLVEAGHTVIDLSSDFRLNDPALYERYYGRPHPRPELMKEAPYVIPELQDDAAWNQAPLIACPGCYPTSVQIPLVPLLRAGLISGQHIVINSYSGVSGAGRKLENRYLFCERAESMTAYGLVSHRHIPEIEEQLSLATGGQPRVVQFNPHLAPIRRGILTTIVCPAPESTGTEAVLTAWNEVYANCPFIQVLPAGTCPDTAAVAGTNRADIAAARDPRTGNLILTAAIDNLLKGAGGQAVQILNRKFGWPETDGLPLF